MLEVVAAFGLGAVLAALAQHFLQRRDKALDSRRQELEARYRVIPLLMYAVLYFEKSAATLSIHRPEMKSQQDVIEELKAEWHNMLLFGSPRAIDALKVFIESPSTSSYLAAISAMRADLGRGGFDVDKSASIFNTAVR